MSEKRESWRSGAVAMVAVVEDGGSCTSDGDRMSTEFEEMGSFSMRKGDTLATIGSLVIESDPDIEDRAFDALGKADAVLVDDLARR